MVFAPRAGQRAGGGERGGVSGRGRRMSQAQVAQSPSPITKAAQGQPLRIYDLLMSVTCELRDRYLSLLIDA